MKKNKFKKIDNSNINVLGAKEHNLKEINVSIPRNCLVVITGISGSGKSSLAFDTIYAEGQRRYMETFSTYARQFIGDLERPDVEKIDGLSPVISIEQKTTGRNPRSTVGTVTEVYDFLRLLFARAGEAYSFETGKKMVQFTEEQIVNHIFDNFNNRKIVLLAPLVRGRKGHYRELFDQYRKQGYTKIRVDNEIIDLIPNLHVDRYKVHDIELVIDRIKVQEGRKTRIINALRMALKLGNGLIMLHDLEEDKMYQFSKNLMCLDTGISYEEPSPNSFSFNSPYGACPNCKGLGRIQEVDLKLVIPDDTKSIQEEGIAPIGKERDNITFKQIKKIAKEYGFSLDTPIQKIPKDALEHILHGNKKKKEKKGYSNAISHEGLINMIKRWHDDTSSEGVRRWAAKYMSENKCETCNGQRLKKESLHFKLDQKNIFDLTEMDLYELQDWVESLEEYFSERKWAIAKDIIKEIKLRIGFLLHVGLDYLTLNRPAATLSGGEAQRIRLATQIGSQLTGVTYILDEPSIGLHQRDNQKLIEALQQLAKIGNSVIVVEHDKDIMLASDYLIDLGPGAGKHGGQLVGQGHPSTFLEQDTITANYLNNNSKIEIPKNRRIGNGNYLKLYGAKGNNLKNVNIEIPLGTLTCVTGVSGSGKSSLINETLYPILRQHFYKSKKKALEYKKIEGLEHLDKVIEIDQSPIGRTPRSNPATYIKLFDHIRKLYANIPEAKIRGYKVGRFSFNVKGGRCEVCQGGGQRVIEMNFLPDVYVDCETCMGKRYNRETLEILYKGKSISDVLEMTVEEATTFFKDIPSIYKKVKTLNDVGLGYITLGQSAPTLSGGEAQRVKLAEELSKRDTGKTIYILDEPTTGLHFSDIQQLLKVIQRLVDKGNTVVIIEHNMDVIKVADHIIDVGLEGGRKGGTIVAKGTPEQIIKSKKSHTGRFLKLEF